MMRYLKQAAQCLLPHYCVLCDKSTSNTFDLCTACHSKLPWITHACPGCAYPFISATQAVCGACLKSPPPYHRMIAACRYEPPFDALIQKLKFYQHIHLAKLLGQLLLERIQQEKQRTFPDCLLPVPLHPRRLFQRGYNQALEIARPLSKQLSIPLETNTLIRIKNTPPQADLSLKQRRKNVKSAFQLAKPLPAEHVVIIDDVVTTGQTIREITYCLKQAGIQKIEVWCCARTL